MTKTAEVKMVPPEDLAGPMCAWEGCKETFAYPMPPDWRNMLVWWSPDLDVSATIEKVACTTTCDRDAALCPTHARELEGLLKDIGRWADRPASGAA